MSSADLAPSNNAAPSTRDSLVEAIIQYKLGTVLLKRKRRLLLDELYRQCLEAEVEPKKRSQRLVEMSKRIATSSKKFKTEIADESIPTEPMDVKEEP
jgi:hypothetical protein